VRRRRRGARTRVRGDGVKAQVYEQTPETPIGSVHEVYSVYDAQPGVPFR